MKKNTIKIVVLLIFVIFMLSGCASEESGNKKKNKVNTSDSELTNNITDTREFDNTQIQTKENNVTNSSNEKTDEKK